MFVGVLPHIHFRSTPRLQSYVTKIILANIPSFVKVLTINIAAISCDISAMICTNVRVRASAVIVHQLQTCTGFRLRVPPNPTHQLEGMTRVVLHVGADDLADHGVLAHQHGGGAAERETDLGHLAGPHVVSL